MATIVKVIIQSLFEQRKRNLFGHRTTQENHSTSVTESGGGYEHMETDGGISVINVKTRRRYQYPVWGGERITLHILFCDQLQEEAVKPPAAIRSWTPVEGDDSNELIPACVVMGHE